MESSSSKDKRVCASVLMHEPSDTSNWAVAANATSIHNNDAPVKSASVSLLPPRPASALSDGAITGHLSYKRKSTPKLSTTSRRPAFFAYPDF